MNRAELHFHLLPGIDDGPADLAESVTLARLAVADGTTLVTVTPHVRDLLARGIVGELPERVAEVRAALAAASVPLDGPHRRGACPHGRRTAHRRASSS